MGSAGVGCGCFFEDGGVEDGEGVEAGAGVELGDAEEGADGEVEAGDCAGGESVFVVGEAGFEDGEGRHGEIWLVM